MDEHKNGDVLLEEFNNLMLLQKYHTLWAAESRKQFDKEASRVKKFFDDDNRYHIEELFKVSDKIWIVVLMRNDESKEIMYASVVNGEDVRDWFDTIERAIVGAISYQLTGQRDAGMWAMKMIESVRIDKE